MTAHLVGVATLDCTPPAGLAMSGFAARSQPNRRRADGSPGYLPPKEEYLYGGYEVEEAHRYYGMPGPFMPGAAEALTKLAAELARSA